MTGREPFAMDGALAGRGVRLEDVAVGDVVVRLLGGAVDVATASSWTSSLWRRAARYRDELPQEPRSAGLSSRGSPKGSLPDLANYSS